MVVLNFELKIKLGSIMEFRTIADKGSIVVVGKSAIGRIEVVG